MLLALGNAAAAQVAVSQRTGSPEHKTLAPKHSISVATWFPLDARHSSGFDTRDVAGSQEEITIYAKRRDLNRDWIGDIEATKPVYEAANSKAAQQIYARPNAWASPEQQRLTSTVKDWLGVCGVAGFTCPNPAP